MYTLLISIVKILIMIVILVAMVLILLGVGQLIRNDEENDVGLKSMRKEIKEKENVIGKNSVFNQFLVKNVETRNKKHP